MPDALAPLAWAVLQALAPLVLLGLSVMFARTLRPGATPLIEQIARRSHPALPAPLRRYTRRLTALWCAYLAVAAGVALLADLPYGPLSLAIWGGAAALFVGERWIRPWLFPGEVFPGLVQQLRDTLSVWRR